MQNKSWNLYLRKKRKLAISCNNIKLKLVSIV